MKSIWIAILFYASLNIGRQNVKKLILNYYKIQDTKTEPLKEVLKYLNGRYVPLVGLLVDWNVCEFSEQDRLDILKSCWSLEDINAQRILSWNVLVSHQARLESLWNCFRMRNWKKKSYIDDNLHITRRKNDYHQSIIDNEILPHCRTSFYNGLTFEQEWFQVGGLCLVTSLTRVLCFHVCWIVKSWLLIKFFVLKIWVSFWRILA
jgi:hypothetical protein